ncbi:MAG: GlsB/YeaQ/YmgE family stress response membrane protein [Pseudolabrys sp.]
MDVQALIIFLIIGAIAGWLAGQIMRGGGFGLIGDIVVGVVGAFIAGLLLPRLGFPIIGGALIGAIIYATIGAIVLLFIVRLIKRA